MVVRPIDANALHTIISAWPESIMYKDWVQSAIATAPTLTPPPAGGGGGTLMDIEKLIEQLRSEAATFRPDSFAQTMLLDAAHALPTLQAENERLRSELKQKSKLIAQQAAELERRDKLLKEQEAELEQVKRERNEAVHDRMMMEQSVGELSARAESAEADNKKLCAAMMQLKRTDRPNRMSVIYELEYDSSMSHKTMEEVAFIVFKGLMDADLKLRGPKEV